MISGKRIFQKVCIICLALVSVALLGVGRRGGFSSHGNPVVSSMVGIFPVWVCLFYKVRFQHLRLLAKYWGLCSVLGGSPFYFLCIKFSRGGSEVSGDFSLTVNFHTICWGLFSAQYYWRSFILLLSCWFLTTRLVEFRCASCTLLYLRDRGSKVLGRTDLWLRAMSWEVLSPPFVFIASWWRKDWWHISPSLWRDLFLWPYSFMFCEEERIK